MEMDHFFVFVNKDFPMKKSLESAGFNTSYTRTHKGQGTSNYVLFFNEKYLEFIWISSEEEAKENPLKLHKRSKFKETKFSPFGIGLRGRINDKVLGGLWDYFPPYAPNYRIGVSNFDKKEPHLPLIFTLQNLSSLDKMWPKNNKKWVKYLNHSNGSKNIKKIIVSGPKYERLNDLKLDNIVEFKNSESFHVLVRTDGKYKKIKVNNTLEVVSD